MKLYTTKTSFVVEQNDSSLHKLFINRDTGAVELVDTVPKVAEQLATSLIHGIVGFIKLQTSDYFIVITGRENVCTIQGKHIYRATSFEIIPLAHGVSDLSPQQQSDESSYVDLLQQHLKSGALYYSNDFDVTNALQRQAESDEKDPLWKRADERFYWNRFISNKLIEAANKQPQFSDFILPLLQGFIELRTSSVNDHSFVFGLFTRRSRHRPGTRYFSRGIDADGHVSNYVETEQVVIYDGPDAKLPLVGKKMLSYVQTRGSIPVYWAQIINLKYTPRLWVGDSKTSATSARTHFDEQISIYGPQILVNLVNTKGYELPMAQAYANVVKQLNDPRLYYTHFDFHKECSKMRWHRIQLLVEELKDRLVDQKYYYVDSVDGIIKKQSSVVRTNCMDCLDRTNVVQSTLAKWILTEQLRELEILGSKDELNNSSIFMVLFRNVWADNADRVSCMYSGTGALKTDFTRTGERTKAGALQDLSNSITRYVKNNFMDGVRQDGFDLFLGNYLVDKASTPFSVDKPLRVRAVPPIVGFALVMLILHLLRPALFGPLSVVTYMAILMFWLSVVLSALKFSLVHSKHFVNLPHLSIPPQPVDDVSSTITSLSLNEKIAAPSLQ
ncbi:SacI homology domain-domain-containing protein [Absidia repens]|uniref:SacI homology domain-domain-containing protein n=1 Tax=Absidia repens TaxID=90262 RepID=A0A1X2IKK6_9FUNG|nr:SacI homology domain-domain-containing protein [Absidia repens]